MENIRRTWAAILFALFFPTLVTWIYFVGLQGTPAGLQYAAYSTGKIIQFTFPLLWLFVLTREGFGSWPASSSSASDSSRAIRSPLGDGESTRRRQAIVWGTAFGLLVSLAMLGLYFAVLKPAGLFDGPDELIRRRIAELGFTQVWKYALLAIFYSVCHSFLEEYYWRWFVFRQLRSLTSLPTAAVVSGLGFMCHHVLVLASYFGWSSPTTWLFSGGIAIGGAIWAWLYDVTRSLAAPWVGHFLVDAAIFVIGYDLTRSLF